MDGFYRMDPLEAAGGWLHGFDTEPLPHDLPGNPREVLDRILIGCLTRTPCAVAFSGGRDSSALLAAAVGVARREGLPLPVAVTLTYPGVVDADEADWQRQVLDHLRVRERIEITVQDEHDPLGPITTPLLERHGSLWPPNLAPVWRLMDSARGGVLLIGESGDEVFGIKRITPLRKIISGRGRASRQIYSLAAVNLAPRPLRRRALLRSHSYRRGWLQPPIRTILERRDVDDKVVLTLHAGQNAWQYTHRRAIVRNLETFRALGRELDVDYVAPFSEPDFVAAVAHAAGFWGWSGRTATMMRLFEDLLPSEVLHRMTKAHFNSALFTEHTRAFARQWGGDGVDPGLVDPEVLRDIWLSDLVDGGTMVLLQQAWLASQPKISQPVIRGAV